MLLFEALQDYASCCVGGPNSARCEENWMNQTRTTHKYRENWWNLYSKSTRLKFEYQHFHKIAQVSNTSWNWTGINTTTHPHFHCFEFKIGSAKCQKIRKLLDYQRWGTAMVPPYRDASSRIWRKSGPNGIVLLETLQCSELPSIYIMAVFDGSANSAFGCVCSTSLSEVW